VNTPSDGDGSSSSSGGGESGGQQPADEGLTSAQRQDIAAAFERESSDYRQRVQGAEAGESDVARQARELERDLLQQVNERSESAGRDVTREDVRVDRTGDRLEAELLPGAREDFGLNPSRRDVRRQVASERDDLTPEDLRVDRAEDSQGFDVSLTDEALEERARADVAAENPGVDPDEVVLRDAENGFDVGLTDEGLADYQQALVDDAPAGARRAVEATPDDEVASDEFRARLDVAADVDGVTADDLEVNADTLLGKDSEGDLTGTTEFTVGLTDDAERARARREGRQQGGEQFGDDGGRVAGIGGAEEALDGLSEQYRGFTGGVAEASAALSPAAAAEEQLLGTDVTERATEGFTKGVLAIGDVPGTIRALDEAGETVGFLASETAQGRGPEAGEDLAEATDALVSEGVDFLQENPVSGTAQATGTLAASAGGIAAASRLSPAAGRGVAAAIQPGEEIAKAGARRAGITRASVTRFLDDESGQLGGGRGRSRRSAAAAKSNRAVRLPCHARIPFKRPASCAPVAG
jgi:hypothetical protein